MLHCQCRNPNIIVWYRSAFDSQRVSDKAIVLGSFRPTFQNRVFCRKRIVLRHIRIAASRFLCPEEEFTQNSDCNQNVIYTAPNFSITHLSQRVLNPPVRNVSQ